jgi:hypothetical protein
VPSILSKNLFRIVYARGFEVKQIEDGSFVLAANLLSGERVVLDSFNSEDDALARITDIAHRL